MKKKTTQSKNNNTARKSSGLPIIITAAVVIVLILLFKFVFNGGGSSGSLADQGVRLLKSNQLAASEKKFQEFLGKDPSLQTITTVSEPALTYIGLGNMALEKRDFVSAARFYDAAHKTDSTADFQELARFARKDLNYPEGVYLDLGNQFWQLNNLDLAELTYKRPLEIYPNLISALTNLGNIDQARHQPDEAIKKYTQALTIDPTAYEARANLLAMALEQDQMSLFNFHIEKMKEYHPDKAVTYHFMGIQAQKKGDHKHAIEYLKKAAEINPKNFKTQFALIESFLSINQPDSAKPIIEELALNYGQNKQIYNESLNIAEKFLELNEVETAKSFYETMSGIWPNDPDLQFGIANCAIKLGQSQEAQAILENMVQNYPDNPQIYSNLGLVYVNMGKYEWAKEQFEYAIKLDSSAIAFYNLGKVYETLGDSVRANSMYLTAAMKDPDMFGLEDFIMEHSDEVNKRIEAGDTAGLIFRRPDAE